MIITHDEVKPINGIDRAIPRVKRKTSKVWLIKTPRATFPGVTNPSDEWLDKLFHNKGE